MSGDAPWPDCPGCGRSVYSVALEWGKRQELQPPEPARWWAKPCCCPLTAEQHAALSKALRPAWRFDVPEVPDSVTAFKDAMANVFVRDEETPEHWYKHPADHQWAPYRFRDLAVHCSLPLVECEDPRTSASTS